jgi:hypothetical protein
LSAYRKLGSLSETDDALQQAWLRLSRLSSEETCPCSPRSMAVATLARNSLPAGDETANRLPQGTELARTRALFQRRHPCAENSAQGVSRIILGSGRGIT